MSENDLFNPLATRGEMPLLVFFRDVRLMFEMDALGSEILSIAFPAALALAADPVASLIDTAFIGCLGAVESAAVGISIAIFNQASKVTIFPLVSITTSFVAEEDTVGRPAREMQGNSELVKLLPEDGELDNIETQELLAKNPNVEPSKLNKTQTKTEKTQNIDSTSNVVVADQVIKTEKRHIPSASTAIVVGAVLGILQTIFLVSLAIPLLGIMGVKSDSPMLEPARRYLRLRSLGSPAVLLSLAMQGVFRGIKDTKTPLYATVAGDLANVVLDPILIFVCRMGVSGAAIAHVLSQYLMLVILFCKLMKTVDLLPPDITTLQFSRFLKNGGYLLARVIAATSCVTLASSLAARLGTTQMAAFQICLQVWMTSSLLADGLAIAVQAIIASAFAKKDFNKACSAASRALQMAFALGLALALVVKTGLQFGSVLFTSDKHVLQLITIGVPFVAATQPINSLAFVFDGVNYGVSDFVYSAYSMVIVAILSITSLLLLCKSNGFVGIWLALTIYMSLRALAGFWRMGTGTGPWRFLREVKL